MANGITSGTGPLPEVYGCNFSMRLKFGSGSVDLEEQMPSGGWLKVKTGITADFAENYYGDTDTTLRFNVTAHTTAIEWKLNGV